MAVAVQNTLVGLGQTIDLLKQILTEVKNTKQDGNIQPADMTVSKRITKSSKNESAISNTTDAIASVSKVNTKGLSEKATTISNTIKTLTSKDVTSGITKLGLLYATGIVGMFNKGIKSIFDTIVEMNNSFGGKFARIKSFNEVIPDFVKTVKMLSSLVLVAAGVGVLSILFAPAILVGFAVITGLVLGVNKLYQHISISAKINNFLAKDFLSFTLSLYALSGLVLVSAAVGAIASNFIGYTLAGFGAIALITFATTSLYAKIAANEKIKNAFAKDFLSFTLSLYALSGLVLVSAAVGAIAGLFAGQIVIGFGAIAAITILASYLFKFAAKAGNVAAQTGRAFVFFTLGMLSLSGLVLISALVGKSVIANFTETMYGLGAILAITLATTGIFLLISLAKSTVIKAMPAFLILGASLFGFAYLVKHLIGIGQEIEKAGGTKNIYKVLGVMGIMIGGITLLMLGLGALASTGIGAVILGAGAITIASIAGVLYLLCNSVLKLSNISNSLGSKEELDNAFDKIKHIAWRMVGLTTAIGAVSLIPINVLGAMSLKNVTEAIESLTSATMSIIFACNLLDTVGGEEEFKRKSEVLTNSLSHFIENIFAKLNPYKDSHRKFRKLIDPLGNVINECSNFLKMISGFKSIGDNIAPVFYKDDGTYTVGAPINVISIGNSIGEAFGLFAFNILDNLEEFGKRAARRTKRAGKAIGIIIDPVTKFASLMKSFTADSNATDIIKAFVTKNGEIVFDKNGNPKTYEINVKDVAKVISSSFGTFSNTLLEKLIKIELTGVSDKSAKILASAMDPVNSFINAVTSLEWDATGNIIQNGKTIDLNKIANNIGTSIKDFMDNLNKITTPLNEEGKTMGFLGIGTGVRNQAIQIETFGKLISNISTLGNSLQNAKISDIEKLLPSVSTFISNISTNADKVDKTVEIVKNTKELTDTLFKNAQTKIKNLKEYYANTKLIAEQLERAATAMEKISKYQDLAINIKNNGNNNTGSQNSTPAQYSSNSNNVTNVTNVNNSAQPTAINNQSSEPDYSLIANAIKEGFGDINKLTVVLDSGDELDLSLAFGK